MKALLAVALLILAPLTPSSDPHRDHLCLNPAYSTAHPDVCADAVDPRDYND